MIQKTKGYVYNLLRWSEKYTKTDMVYLASGGFWLVVGQVVSSLSALALAIAFANLVPAETYGTYKYLLSVASIFAIFSLPGMQTAISRSTAQQNLNIIHDATKSRILFALLGSVAALAGSMYYFINQNIELSLALFIIATTLPFFETFTGYLAYFSGIRRFDLQTKYHAIAQILSILSLIGTLLITDKLIFILLAYFIPLSIIRIILYFYSTKMIPRKNETSEINTSLTYGKHLTAMSIISIIAGNIDKILLWKFLGPAQLAIYAFALAIPEQLKGPFKGVGDLAFPKFSTQTADQIKKNFNKLFYKIFFYAVSLMILTFFYILCAPFIFSVMFPAYVESVKYSQVLSLSFVTTISVIFLSILESQKKIKAQYLINTIQPLIHLLLLFFLVPVYGIMGAVLSFVIGRFILTIIVIFMTLQVVR